ncbi:DegT/DnrJ/EryC1/StrS family aminotransferase [Desulfogranum marinum]|uniref:DegT/DnrJ/EryC1/StrS family aminotransferase n=1 Tax=Desulfogranum marinum TaxID=453220 RepID=UPI0029C7C065|nr:DegT/DnrJ/EryC1/StrS family aminotransferase [Desulfogranum marinum]
MNKRIFLSAPHMGGEEVDFISEAFASNYIAPVGPQIDAFEREFAETVGTKFAVGVSAGTAALHLLLRCVGVGAGDDVFCSDFTFVASANPILYCGATPVFIDSEYSSWNMDPLLLAKALGQRARESRLPKAVVLVHLYGQPADIDPIKEVCDQYQVALIEDAAEALGAEYKEKAPGTIGLAGFYSFNGNKIITTSGGGMIVTDNEELANKVKFWSTQARDNAVHYEHTEIGYNYRMSNVLAAIGRGQLRVLPDRVVGKRKIFAQYRESLGDLPGVAFMPEPAFACSTRWLTCLTIDPDQAGVNRDGVIRELEKNNIESRPTWKPMHMQPLFKGCQVVGGSVSEHLFSYGLCLPSGTNMTEEELARVISVVRGCWG